MVAAEKSLAMAPAAAADDDPGASGFGLGDKIGAVGDELRIQAEQRA
jgi:hypothetical protein